jgi:hypothetical protein
MCEFFQWQIIVAALASFMVGAVWYAPPVLGNRWAKAAGVTPPDTSDKSACKGMCAAMIGQLLMDYLAAGILYFFLQFMQIHTATGGLMVGLLAALGFACPIAAASVLFEKKPVAYMAITLGHRIVSLSVAGAVLGAWV